MKKLKQKIIGSVFLLFGSFLLSYLIVWFIAQINSPFFNFYQWTNGQRGLVVFVSILLNIGHIGIWEG